MLNTSLSGWRTRLAELLRRAQTEGSVRTDVDADTLATFFWDAWEGALLRMKLEKTTAPLHDSMALVLDHNGWAGFREAPITLGKAAGLALIIGGVWLIRRG